MSTDRRSFLKAVSAVGGAAGLGVFPTLAHAADVRGVSALPAAPVEKAPASLNILIIGGTSFTGPEQVEYALARGHRVTLFNRNQTRPDFFKGRVDTLIGDLNDDTSALEGKRFDVVLDNPTTFPAWVRNVGKYLKGNVGHYIFISTTSTYQDNGIIGLNEESPVKQMPEGLDPYTIDPANRGRYYGELKVRAEEEVKMTYPDRWTIIRPCLIVGPLDPTDRFTWWPARLDEGGEVLAPNTPDDPCQFTDSRDLAEWMIRVAEQKVFGLYNAIGPDKPMTTSEMIYGVRAVTTAGAQITWVPWDFLKEQKVRGWRDMTVWQPPYGHTAGYQRRSGAKAVAAGLTFRPVAVTAKDTLDWQRTRPAEERQATLNGEINGIGMKREAEVLAAWHAHQNAGG